MKMYKSERRTDETMDKRGKLLIISGFSGVGKGTVVKRLLDMYKNYAISVSATTRKPREGEIDGKSYFFKTVDEFKTMIDKNEFLEYAQYVNNYYGTPKAYVEQQLSKGNNVILEIEVVGACNVKKIYSDAVMIFIVPPNAKELCDRLTFRGTEAANVIRERLTRAVDEADDVEKYDYVVVNDTIENCVDTINDIANDNSAIMERCKISANLPFIKVIKNDLKNILKGE